MIIHAALLLAPANVWDPVVARLDAVAKKDGFARGYRRQPAGPSSITIGYRKGNEASIEVTATRNATDSATAIMREANSVVAGGIVRSTYLSGMPLGNFCLVASDGMTVRSGGAGVLVDVSATARGSARNAIYARLVESMSRTVFAETLGGAAPVDGQPAPGEWNALLKPYSSVAKSSATRENDWSDRLSIAGAKRSVELALGSDLAKVDGTMVPMDGFVASKDGVWLAPKNLNL